jgi:DMSO/TMAO reductase YedYZ heme-binding membrane subunit
VSAISGERLRGALAWVLTGVAAVALPLGAGFGFARLFAPTLHSKYFPWLTGRALGIAAYIALTALVILGVWMRHPWRLRRPLVHPETRLRVHATLATATIALVAGHLVSLASDKYAGVGWIGAFVPFKAQYRPTAVSLGVIAMLFMVLLFATARSAGRLGARHWLAYHRLAAMNFALVWFHGVMAGTDTAALRTFYVVTGGVVVFLTLTRYALVRRSRVEEEFEPRVARAAYAAASAPGPFQTEPGPATNTPSAAPESVAS